MAISLVNAGFESPQTNSFEGRVDGWTSYQAGVGVNVPPLFDGQYGWVNLGWLRQDFEVEEPVYAVLEFWHSSRSGAIGSVTVDGVVLDELKAAPWTLYVSKVFYFTGQHYLQFNSDRGHLAVDNVRIRPAFPHYVCGQSGNLSGHFVA